MGAAPVGRSAPYKSPRSGRGERVKQALGTLLEQARLAKPVFWVWRTVKGLFWKCRWGWVRLTAPYDRNIDIDRVYWISPQRIVYSALQEFNIRDFKGRVIGGDWDRLEKRFCDLDIYRAFADVCVKGRPWTETFFYQNALEELAAGQVLWGCRTREEFDRRCEQLEDLFDVIRREGYKSQAELMQARRTYNPMQADEEVIVSIGRRGDLLFSDGAHRLAIANLLEIPRIPVKIAVRHPGWVETGGEREWMERIELEDAGVEGRNDE
jgi:hypothetical protein